MTRAPQGQARSCGPCRKHPVAYPGHLQTTATMNHHTRSHRSARRAKLRRSGSHKKSRRRSLPAAKLPDGCYSMHAPAVCHSAETRLGMARRINFHTAYHPLLACQNIPIGTSELLVLGAPAITPTYGSASTCKQQKEPHTHTCR